MEDRSPGELEAVLRLHEDTTHSIAAGKVLRWEVLKWTVTINVLLATAATASAFDATSRLFILFFAAAVSALGQCLMVHYNTRLTHARERLRKLNHYLQTEVADINEIGGVEWDREKTSEYDRQELRIYTAVIWLSLIPAIAAWLIR